MAPKFELPRIYPITDRIISSLSHQEQIAALIEGGSDFIQLRDKTASSRDLFETVSSCLAITRERNSKLIVNDRADIAKILKADGVHLGQDDLPPDEARKLLGDQAIIGVSTHNLEQVRKARKLPVDYIAYGPIFPTDSKADHEAVVGLESIKRVREEIGDLPLVAIGGIRLENLSAVFEAGADSAAMIGALLSQPNNIAEKVSQAITLGLLTNR